MKTVTYDDAKWKLMPVSINEDMHVAAVLTIAHCSGNDDFPRRVYDAMSIAAPLPPEVKPISVPEPTARELDMAALVKRLARQVRRAEPYGTNYHKLSDDALDALKRWGLDGSPMRSTPPAVEPYLCPKCGVDGGKVPCPGDLMNCPIRGEAQDGTC